MTYTPSHDRILPSPDHLHVKVKNTSPIPLRAAYLHGPYSLHVATYSSDFNPNKKLENPQKSGVPEFEPFLKAGSHWTCRVKIPEEIKENGAEFTSHDQRTSHDLLRAAPKNTKSVTWIIEIASQVIFSASAAVHFEVLVGRDERSLELGFAAVAGHGHGAPGQVSDHQKDRKRTDGPVKGVYSRAVRLTVEDTTALWDKPKLPTWEDLRKERGINPTVHDKPPKRKVHLVVLTHGLHSNLSADMLYMKESIDATVRQAREDARRRKETYKAGRPDGKGADPDTEGQATTDDSNKKEDTSTAPLSGGQEELGAYDEDEEQVIVRGFSGNAVRTERGIQYLGKRLAKFVLNLTHPSQPYLPVKKSMSRKLTDKFTTTDDKKNHESAAHLGSSIHKDEESPKKEEDLAYKYTSISFIGHSLGGLIQMYAIAYIQKHAPDFFQQVKPVNFVCMASPLLGLSNENPMYVKFALDFGLVGRTGQDLGLTWRPPTIARSGWDAMLGFGGVNKEPKQEDPGAKPLLRILPTGPAHTVLHMFRNRTLYSNVVNDGIVPLRTSCLLFLDWKGLGKVDKARRENGLLGTMVEWGFQELTGANADPSDLRSLRDTVEDDDAATEANEGDAVPQPSENATQEDNTRVNSHDSAADYQQPHASPTLSQRRMSFSSGRRTSAGSLGETGQTSSFFNDVLGFFRPKSPVPEKKSPKVPKAIRRGQTLSKEEEEAIAEAQDDTSRGSYDNPTMRPSKRPIATRGFSANNPQSDMHAPPKTSVFESARDILHPPIPSTSWIIDPAARKRTIFHDRVYHPEDIPDPPIKRPGRIARTFSSDASTMNGQTAGPASAADSGNMKVEEKIARAYHHDLSWRKVLVRLEPDAHNNMIVRRMFANAYGWPVVKHLCDTHFANTFSATTRDEDEPAIDRAKAANERVSETGEEVVGQMQTKPPERRDSEMREHRDELGDLNKSTVDIAKIEAKHKDDKDRNSGVWDDSYFSGSDDEDEEEEESYRAMMQRLLSGKRNSHHSSQVDKAQPGHAESPTTNDDQVSVQPTSTGSPKSSANQSPVLSRYVEPPSIEGANSAVEVGLRKSIEEQLTPPRKRGQENTRTDSGGKAERVAEASKQHEP